MRKGMYLDSSAMISVLLKHPGWEDVSRRMDDYSGKMITSPISVCETVTAIVGDEPTEDLIAKASELVTTFLAEVGAQPVTISGAQTTAAMTAFGNHVSAGHNAPLSISDMIVMGVAKSFRCGILYSGDRFADL